VACVGGHVGTSFLAPSWSVFLGSQLGRFSRLHISSFRLSTEHAESCTSTPARVADSGELRLGWAPNVFAVSGLRQSGAA
jgi:hypothetical protein